MARSKNPRPLSPEQKARVEEADYANGFGKPPEDRRFKKGQSGNPSGRPRRPTIHTLLKGLLERELAGDRGVTVKEALVQIVGAHGLKGTSRDREFLFRLLYQHMPEEFQETTERTLNSAERDIVERFARKIADSPFAVAVEPNPTNPESPEPSEEDWDIL